MVLEVFDKIIIIIMLLFSIKYLYVKFFLKNCANNCPKKTDNSTIKLGFKAKKYFKN